MHRATRPIINPFFPLDSYPKSHDPPQQINATTQLFGRDAIYGGTKESERERLLAAFRISNRVNTIFLSRVRLCGFVCVCVFDVPAWGGPATGGF